MPAVSLYAALLAILYAGLSVRTLRLRRQLRIAIGDKGDERMLRAMRAHANFAEYVPLALLLIYLVEIARPMPCWSMRWAWRCCSAGRCTPTASAAARKTSATASPACRSRWGRC